MKIINKIISIFIIAIYATNITGQLCYAKAQPTKKTVLKATIKKEIKNDQPKTKYESEIIEDELAKEIEAQSVQKIKYKKLEIKDDAVAILPVDTKAQKRMYKEEILDDEKVVISKSNKKYKPSDYVKQVKTENGSEVILRPVKRISTKSKRIKIKKDTGEEEYRVPFPSIGDKVAFKVVKDVIKDGKIVIPKGTIVYASVGEVAPRAMGGAPAEMTLENFEMKDKNGNMISLDGEIASSGYSLSFWIGLAELATTPFLFGLAVPLLRVLPGGQAVVSPKKNYVVYY